MPIGPWSDKIRRFTELDPGDKRLFLRAVFWIAVARIWVAAVPFPRLAAKLNKSGGSTEADPELLKRVGLAVSAAAGNVPWRSDCFPQAIAAHKLLQSHGCASVIHIGVDNAGDGRLQAHAWLTCGETIVTGAQEQHRFVEIHRLGA